MVGVSSGFDVAFPAIGDARERLRSCDDRLREFGVQAGGALEDAAGAAGIGGLGSALSSLYSAFASRAHKAADVAHELRQALDKAQEAYESTDHHAGDDIAAVRFGGHDGHT